jgi:hypothetical protein
MNTLVGTVLWPCRGTLLLVVLALIVWRTPGDNLSNSGVVLLMMTVIIFLA